MPKTEPPDTAAMGLPNVGAMLAEMEDAPEIVQPSAFWRELNAKNRSQLAESGFAEFKRTVNHNYFQFIPPQTKHSEQGRAVLKKFARQPSLAPFGARYADPSEISTFEGGTLSRLRTMGYAFYVGALWEYTKRRDTRNLLERLEEPELGHPFTIRHRGRLISEDLCNSMLELTAMLDGMGLERMPPGSRMIELGAGYGRLTWAFMSSFPELRCVIVDIPPALAVSERYLTQLFPDRRAFTFRHFDEPAEVAEELDAASIAFLTPNQLLMLDPLRAELFATVSSLHEMRPEQIRHYIEEAGKHCPGGHMYTKQWQWWRNPTDEVEIGQADYPIPSGWRTVFERQHPIQALFFEALYSIPAEPG